MFSLKATTQDKQQEPCEAALAWYKGRAEQMAQTIVELQQQITALKRTEALLSQSEERYRRVVEDQTDLICRFTPDFKLTFVNRPYSQAFGKSPHEMVGESMLDVIPLDYQPRVITHLSSLNATQRVGTCENPVRLADGVLHWFHWTNYVVVDTVGQIVEYQSVGRDITELRFYASLQENVSDAVISTDLNFRIQSWNRAAEAIYGWRAAEVIGKNVAEILQTHYPSPAMREQASQELFKQGWWQGEVVQHHRNGSPLHILGSVTVQRDASGVPSGVVAVNHDITKRQEAEEALRKYAEEVKDLYNNAPCGYHSLDQEGVFVQINDTELRWLGYSREEVVGRLKLADLLTSASKDLFAAAFPRFKEQGWVKDIECDLIRKDGSIMTVLLSATAVYDEQRRFLASRATIYDITELKQAQQVIHENEKKFRLLVEVAPLAILISDENGKITLVNEQAEQLFGYAQAELLGQSVEILVPQGARALHPQHRAAYLAAPAMRRMARGRELFAVRKDGSEFPVEVQLSFTENQTGSFIMDITERKQAAAALREQRDFLQLVVDSVPDIILVKDRAGYFHLVNEGTAKIYGTTPTVMVGQRDADIHDNPAAVTLFRQQDLATMDSGQSLFIPETIIQGRCYQANLIPLRNRAGQYDRVLMVASDVTERKRAEETLQQAFTREKELSELKSRFVSVASHEFRTPLSTIAVLTETLSAYRYRLTADQIAQRLDKIRDQVAYLNDVVEDVLQLTHIQARQAKFEPVQLDLNALCRSIIDEFQSQPAVAQRLSYSCDTQLPTLKLDKRLMRQIMNNLITNAIKYSVPDKRIVVNVTCTGEVLILQVCDEGIGIPKADLKYLFEPFHRAANVGAISGTGLGLAITKEAVEMHGGVISVESQLGVGTTFTIRIPVATSNTSGAVLHEGGVDRTHLGKNEWIQQDSAAIGEPGCAK